MKTIIEIKYARVDYDRVVKAYQNFLKELLNSSCKIKGEWFVD